MLGFKNTNMLWMVGLCALFVVPSAYAFNVVLLMDPDFLEYFVVQVPLLAALLMGVFEGIVTMRWLKPKDTPVIFYCFTYVFACFVGMLLSIFIIGILFFAVGEKLQESKEPIFVWSALGYFAVMFLFLGWDQRRREIVKMWGKDEAKYLPIKPILLITTCISYSVLYVFLYNELF